MPRKGGKIRILQDDYMGARVFAGDVLEVTGRVTAKVFVTESPRNEEADGWWFPDHGEGEGWEHAGSPES